MSAQVGVYEGGGGYVEGWVFCVFVWCEAIERGQFIGNLLQVEWPR